MAASVFKAGNTALITGGASGIGLALAKKCHNYGMRVAIVDINKEHLELAKKSVGERTSVFAVDVGKIEEWNSLKQTVEKDFGMSILSNSQFLLLKCHQSIYILTQTGRIDLLALNAGIGLKSTWSDAAYFHKIMDTNLFGVIHGISTFLPSMQASASASNPAAIIITGSKQGITNPPGNPAYNASKSAVKTLAEHLSYDLRGKDGAAAAINVHLLVPGWTYTGLSGGKPGSVEGKPAGAWSSEQVVDYLEEKMLKNAFYIICPDNDVNEDTDKRRMMYSVGDIVQGRPPLNRWREDWKDKAAEEISKMKI
jgi:NAD(P)-dependent dehydrogenase (short-subunit alcohol dehydrogenase family)